MGRLNTKVPSNIYDLNVSSGRGFTLLELIVVIGIISFLSNVVIRQISTGLEQKNLAGAADNLAVYFSNASSHARDSGKWVYVVINVTTDPDDEGYEGSLRQIGTYQWYEGPDPREPENPSNNNNDSNLIKGWMVKDPKGYWLPNKIFFNPKLSGPATVEDETTEPLKGRGNSRFNHFSLTQDESGNLPFFIERDTGNFPSDHDGNPSVEKDRGKDSNWIFFAFDPYGSYRDILAVAPSGPDTSGTKDNTAAAQDYIVLSQGFLKYEELEKANSLEDIQINPLNNGQPEHSAFVIHRYGSCTKCQDESQIPSL